MKWGKRTAGSGKWEVGRGNREAVQQGERWSGRDEEAPTRKHKQRRISQGSSLHKANYLRGESGEWVQRGGGEMRGKGAGDGDVEGRIRWDSGW